MRHQIPYRKLSRHRSHYTALMRNLAFSLFEKEKIHTTEAKAKEVRRFVDKLVTLAKGGTLHHQRQVRALLGNKVIGSSKAKASGIKGSSHKVDIVGKLFKDLAVRLKDHQGGYTRITKTGYRPGDAAPKVILELVKIQIAPKKPKKGESGEKDSSKAAAA